jgi:hypothetical protein
MRQIKLSKANTATNNPHKGVRIKAMGIMIVVYNTSNTATLSVAQVQAAWKHH